MTELKVTHVPSEQTQIMDIPTQSHSLQDMRILTVENVSSEQIDQLRSLVDELRKNNENVVIIPLSEDMRIEQLKFETRAPDGGYFCPECGHEMHKLDDEFNFVSYLCYDCSIKVIKHHKLSKSAPEDDE